MAGLARQAGVVEGGKPISSVGIKEKNAGEAGLAVGPGLLEACRELEAWLVLAFGSRSSICGGEKDV